MFSQSKFIIYLKVSISVELKKVVNSYLVLVKIIPLLVQLEVSKSILNHSTPADTQLNPNFYLAKQFQ